jgi:sulfofructose kinase
VPLAEQARRLKIPTVLDAGSLHDGTRALLPLVDYAVCSEKFALQYAENENAALQQLAALVSVVVITLGERGVIWQRGTERGALAAMPVNAIDTTGAGDAFHGAFAYALTQDLAWQELLRYASVAGSLCCTKIGARLGLATLNELTQAMG